MELRQLKYFLAVAEERQITKAAERLNMTQPPLSQQLILLEKELGVQLMQRDKKRIRLTEAGHILHKRAEQILELVNTTVDEVREADSGISGQLTIGTITSFGRSYIPEYIRQYHQRYPRVTFTLRQGETSRILELLDSGIIEIGIVRLPVNTTQYESIVLPSENMMAVMTPEMNDFPDGAELQLAHLKDKSILINRRYVPQFTDYCKKAGFEPTILCQSDDVTALLIWMRMGLGIAILPKTSLHMLQGSPLVVRKIANPSLEITSAIIWLKKHSLSTAAAHFIDLFQQDNPKAPV